GVVALLPAWVRTNRVLAAGYGIEDLRIAIREYWVRRREELAYEVSSSTSTRTTLAVFGTTAAGAILLHLSGPFPGGGIWPSVLYGFLMMASAFSGVALVGRLFRSRFGLGKLGISQVKFYDSKWGERFVKLCGIGLKKRTPSQSLSQLTE